MSASTAPQQAALRLGRPARNETRMPAFVGVGSEIVQRLSTARMQAQVQRLLTGLTETRSAPEPSTQQPACDQDTIASPARHNSSQQACAAQASSEGASEEIARRLPQLPQEPEVAQDGPVAAEHPAASKFPGDTASIVEAQCPNPMAAGPPPERSAAHSKSIRSHKTAGPRFQLLPFRLLASAGVEEAPLLGAVARISPMPLRRGQAARPAECGDAARPGSAPAQCKALCLPPASAAPCIADALQPDGQPFVRVLPSEQPDPSERVDSVRDVAVQQLACQNPQAHPPQAEANQDGGHSGVPKRLIAGENPNPSKDTQSIDVGGSSCLQPLQQAFEAPVARSSKNDTAIVDIMRSCTLGSAPEVAAHCTPGSASHGDTVSVDITGSGFAKALPQVASHCVAACAGEARIIGPCNDSEAGAAAVPAVTTVPVEKYNKRNTDNNPQQGHPAAATSEAGRQVGAASARKRPCSTQQGASGRQIRLQRTLRELDVDPSSSLALSGSEWLPAKWAKTRQQARASQPTRNLRGRQIPLPGIPCSGLPFDLVQPPGIAPAAEEQHAQAWMAAACAQELAEAMPERGLEEREATQQQPLFERQTHEDIYIKSTALPAVQAQRPLPPQTEPQKGSRELHSLFTIALATPGHQAGDASLYRQLTGRTRAQSAPQPTASEVPVDERQKASAKELAMLLEAAAAVSPRDARSAPLNLQAPGRTRAQSTFRHSTSQKPLSLRKDRKPNRELAALLHAAAEVPPKHVSSAPLYLGATRRAVAQSTLKPGVKEIAPGRAQAQPEAPPKPKPMRGVRELAALHNGLFTQAANHPRRGAPVMRQQAETASLKPVPINAVPAAAGQDSTPDREPSGSRERQWAASGQPMGQLDRRAAHMQTRRAGQVAAVQGRSIAQCTRRQNTSLGMHAPTGSSVRQILGSRKPRVKQTARKQSVGKAALAGQTKYHRHGHVMRGGKQPAERLGHPVQASPVKVASQKAGRAPAGIARSTAVKAAWASAAAHAKVGNSAGGSTPRHAAPKRGGLAVKRAPKQAPRATARTLAGAPHRYCDAAEGLSSVASQGPGVPQRLDEAALRRSARAAAGERFRQTLERAKDPLRAARAEVQQTRAAQEDLLGQNALGRSGRAGQPRVAAPTQEAAPLESGAGSCREASRRPMRRASLGIQHLVDAYRLPWNAPEPTTGKRPRQSVDGTEPSKRACSDQLPERAEAHHRSAALGSTPGSVSEKAATLQAAGTPSMVQGASVPSTRAPRSPARTSMQQGWSLPAPERPVVAPVRPQQVFSVRRLRQPLQINSGAATSRHAAHAASTGSRAAPGNAAEPAARIVLQEFSGIVKRARTQRAGPPGQRAAAQGRAKLPKQMRRIPGAAAQGLHVLAHQPAGKKAHSNLADRPSLPSQAETPRSRANMANGCTAATSPQSKASQHNTCSSWNPQKDALNLT